MILCLVYNYRKRQLLSGIAVWLSEGSGWIIVSTDDHHINTAVYIFIYSIAS